MPNLIDKHYVRLDDGTCWAFDRDDEEGAGLEWQLRYGRDADVLKARLVIAEILGTYRALLHKPQKRRNEVVTAIRAALLESAGR